jgi:hypothetical protein
LSHPSLSCKVAALVVSSSPICNWWHISLLTQLHSILCRRASSIGLSKKTLHFIAWLVCTGTRPGQFGLASSINYWNYWPSAFLPAHVLNFFLQLIVRGFLSRHLAYPARFAFYFTFPPGSICFVFGICQIRQCRIGWSIRELSHGLSPCFLLVLGLEDSFHEHLVLMFLFDILFDVRLCWSLQRFLVHLAQLFLQVYEVAHFH